MDNRTTKEWVQLLSEYEEKLNLHMRKGCTPSEYRKLVDLVDALEIVIHKIGSTIN